MRPIVRIAFALASVVLLVATPLSAQRGGKPVPRPKLRDVTDTNDAQAYYEAGLQQVNRDPDYAADAFYWAARINPGWAEPLYGRRAALLLQRRTLLNAYMTADDRHSRSKELVALDSLYAHALMLNPFLYRRLDRELFMSWLTSGDRQAAAEYAYEINTAIMRAPPATQAWFAYSNGNFERALDLYGRAIEQAREPAGLHIARARILGMRNDVESAVAEFEAALGEMRAKDEKKLVVLYDSKAMAEYSIGTLLEGAGNAQKARDAYGRALQEDLSYYPAHMRLGLLALSQGDTTAAISELALASDIATDDAYIHYLNGWVLGKARHTTEAVAELTKATTLEPYYALPNLVLGATYETLEKAPEAIAAYQRFLTLASARDPQRDFATSRIADLKEFLNAPKTQ